MGLLEGLEGRCGEELNDDAREPHSSCHHLISLAGRAWT